MTGKKSIVMVGATGAVGGEVVKVLVGLDALERLTLLGRHQVPGISNSKIAQHVVDVLDSTSYEHLLAGHTTAICTLGVGQPSKTARDVFTRVDRDAPLDFGRVCRSAGVEHFQLLSSVGADAASRSYYLRSKGELEAGLTGLGFPRLSLFEPSMILTPSNRYGISQGLMLAVWPWLEPLLRGPMRRLRGIEVDRLGAAIALNAVLPGAGVETLVWDDIVALASTAGSIG